MRLGTYFGIPLKVNPFFLLLLGIAFYCGKLPEALLLFAIVFWHESFHIAAARLYNLDVVEVELLPFGGVARLEALLQLNPRLEGVIAIVGPLSNILLVLLGFLASPYLAVSQKWFDFFVQANLGMALFNLLPALPLDGGRVLRSILVRKRGFQQATAVAAGVGQICAVLLFLWGAYGIYLGEYNSVIFLAAGFLLFWAAYTEKKTAGYVFMRYLSHKKREMRLQRVLTVRNLAATSEASLGEVLKQLQPPHYHFIWVLDLEGQILGRFGELELINALFEHGLSVKVGVLLNYKV
ncbi:MAG TPA: peptidase M50 [Firmicutes bacterium]|nr:peptidase M50 [Bacillota bacterium]